MFIDFPVRERRSPTISIRSLAILILSAVLSAAPLIHVKYLIWTQTRVINPPGSLIQELPLPPQLSLYPSLRLDAVPAVEVKAPDLSRYREFHFGMTPPAVAQLTGLEVGEAKVIHQRPAVLQEMNWRPVASTSSSPADPIGAVMFSFYNGQLFRMMVSYDREKTEWLTPEDLIEAISARYGTPTRPAVEITFSSSQVESDSEKVLARWEDSQYSYNLFRSSFQHTLAMLLFSKR